LVQKGTGKTSDSFEGKTNDPTCKYHLRWRAGCRGRDHRSLIHLKNKSPHLKIEVFEKSSAPVQKIGESTLSPFSKFTASEMLSQEYLLRLFGLKDGLQFYSIDERGASIVANDVGAIDVSFQLDRRMSELFFTMWAQKIGINVYHGFDVAFDVGKGDTSGAFAQPTTFIPRGMSDTADRTGNSNIEDVNIGASHR